MEILPIPECSQWDAAPPVKFEEQELDILAFELWRRANCDATADDEYCAGDQEVLRCHASCL